MKEAKSSSVDARNDSKWMSGALDWACKEAEYCEKVARDEIPIQNGNGLKWCRWKSSFGTQIALRGYPQHVRTPSQSKNGYMVDCEPIVLVLLYQR